jgi:peptidoglycan/LPS O-acetylase OafA/YrhL
VNEREHSFEYQPALDGVRALAVLAVMAYHYPYVWAKGGFLGVDAFFVLSGFLITSLLVLEWQKAQSIALVAFWGRRIRRLLPALLLVILFVAIYGWIAVPPDQLDRLRNDGLAGLFYVANWRFIIAGQSYFDLFTSPSPFRHLWSLAIEEQFYLVWPLVVFGCLRVARGKLRVLVGVCVAGVIGSVILMSVLFDEGDPSRAYYGTDSRAHTLLVGCLLALLLLRWKPTSRQMKVGVQALGVVGGLFAIWSWNQIGDIDPGYYGIGSLVYAIAIAAVILAAVQPGRGPLRSPLSWRPLRWIGTISYGLYLWHWPINIWLVHWRIGFGGSAQNALRLAVTFAFATASYYLVERPVRQGRFLGLGRPALRWVAPAGILLVAVTLVVSTGAASKTPTYFGVGTHPTACPTPRPDELRAARTAMRNGPAVAGDPAVRGDRILLVGDSIACSLWPGLKVVGRAADLKTDQAAVIACGITGVELMNSDIIVPPNSDECRDLVDRTLKDGLQRSRPDVVLWLSTWERADFADGDRSFEAGTKAWERATARNMERVLRRLRRTGAHVVVATMAPAAPSRFHQLREGAEAAEEQAFDRLNLKLLELAGKHPEDVTIIDLAGKVCPKGPPCPAHVDGFTPRGFDGAHLSPRGAVWASEWLLPTLEAAAKKPASGT